MNSNQEGLRSLAVGCYAWLTAVFFGATLLDRVYSKALSDNPGALKSTTVFSDVSDFLLLIGFVTILAAIGAIVFAWRSAAARSLFIASILVLSLEFLTPIIFSAFVPDGQTPSIGPWLRIIPSGLASALAYAGLLHR